MGYSVCEDTATSFAFEVCAASRLVKRALGSSWSCMSLLALGCLHAVPHFVTSGMAGCGWFSDHWWMAIKHNAVYCQRMQPRHCCSAAVMQMLQNPLLMRCMADLEIKYLDVRCLRVLLQQ
jgi:hypothetical protein